MNATLVGAPELCFDNARKAGDGYVHILNVERNVLVPVNISGMHPSLNRPTHRF
jgi:hypothetical protein